MKYVNYMDLNISQLRIFLSLAKTLSFTRTADECMVSQPTVSKTIKTLEGTLGMRLFTRERGHVELTPEGESLSHDLDGFYALLTTSVAKAASIGDRRPDLMAIAIPSQHFMGERFMDALRSYALENPSLEVTVSGYDDVGILKDVEAGSCDLAIGFFGVEQYRLTECIRTRTITSDPLCVYMLDSCPLSSLDEIHIEDLEGMSLVTFDASMDMGESMQRFVSEALFGDVSIAFGKFVRQQQEAFDNLLRPNDVFISNRYMSGGLLPGIVGRPLAGPSYDLMVAWRDDKWLPFVESLSSRY